MEESLQTSTIGRSSAFDSSCRTYKSAATFKRKDIKSCDFLAQLFKLNDVQVNWVILRYALYASLTA